MPKELPTPPPRRKKLKKKLERVLSKELENKMAVGRRDPRMDPSYASNQLSEDQEDSILPEPVQAGQQHDNSLMETVDSDDAIVPASFPRKNQRKKKYTK